MMDCNAARVLDMARRMAEVRKILDRIRYKDWHFRVFSRANFVFFHVVCLVPDPDTGVLVQAHGRIWPASPYDIITDSPVVRTAYRAIQEVEEYALRSAFRYKGERIFGPNLDVNMLVDAIQIDAAIRELAEEDEGAYSEGA